MLTAEEALRKILQQARPTPEERVPLSQALGRVLSQAVSADRDEPAFTNSAVDGWAVRSADLHTHGSLLRVVGESAAGGPPPPAVEAGTCVRIFTGAPLPSGADAVVMQEDCTYDAGRVEISAAVQPGENLRVRGCVRTAGERIAEAGTRIGAAEVMALASVGCVQPLCRARPRVAVFSTGDELVPPQEIPGPYQLRDSNRMALEALVLQNGGDTVISACLPDDPEAVRRALRSGGECDLILTSGGVSVGDRDCIRPAVEELGEISLWRISIKPGKPLAFGSVGTALFMGLPGNPLSTIITFELFARPLLWALQGSTRFTRKRVQGTLAQPVAHRPGRTEYLAVRAEWHHNRWSFSPLGGRGSGDTAAMVGADALAVIPADAEDMPAGSHVEAILL